MSVTHASLRYSLSQVGREKQSILIGCSTIGLIVLVSTFICVFMQNSNSLFYMMALDNIGDIDIMLTSN